MVQKADGKGDDSSGEGKRPRDMIKIKVISTSGDAALVEWLDKTAGLSRVTVPMSELKGNRVASDVLEMGIPHGEFWADAVKGVPQALEQELYRHGIWTKEDLLAKSSQVRGAIQKVTVVPLLEKLVRYAKQ